jgi:hypothetical protein
MLLQKLFASAGAFGGVLDGHGTHQFVEFLAGPACEAGLNAVRRHGEHGHV